MSRRSDIVLNLAAQEGTGAITPLNTAQGWPTLVRVRSGTQFHDFSLHASVVGSHSRAPHEYRFQNPADGTPVSGPNPVLLGYFHDGYGPDVFVGVSGLSRLGNGNRFSILFHKSILDQARIHQWSSYISNKDEEIVSFLPGMSPVVFEALAASMGTGTSLVSLLQSIDVAASEATQLTGVPAAKTSSYVLRAVRNRAFALSVMNMDGGQCCFCGIQGPMLQAAHIHPHSAPNSTDQVENGLALCANHHSLFDSHHVGIRLGTFDIIFSPKIISAAQNNNALRAFLNGTFAQPVLGARNIALVRHMFDQRFRHFGDAAYWWLR
jgi:hypothetical protein